MFSLAYAVISQAMRWPPWMRPARRATSLWQPLAVRTFSLAGLRNISQALHILRRTAAAAWDRTLAVSRWLWPVITRLKCTEVYNVTSKRSNLRTERKDLFPRRLIYTLSNLLKEFSHCKPTVHKCVIQRWSEFHVRWNIEHTRHHAPCSAACERRLRCDRVLKCRLYVEVSGLAEPLWVFWASMINGTDEYTQGPVEHKPLFGISYRCWSCVLDSSGRFGSRWDAV